MGFNVPFQNLSPISGQTGQEIQVSDLHSKIKIQGMERNPRDAWITNFKTYLGASYAMQRSDIGPILTPKGHPPPDPQGAT